MACTIKGKNGKSIGIIDCENESIIINNKAIPLSDVYADDKLKTEFNDEIKQSANEINHE